MTDRPMTRWERLKDNDIFWSFINSPGAMIAAFSGKMPTLMTAGKPIPATSRFSVSPTMAPISIPVEAR